MIDFPTESDSSEQVPQENMMGLTDEEIEKYRGMLLAVFIKGHKVITGAYGYDELDAKMKKEHPEIQRDEWIYLGGPPSEGNGLTVEELNNLGQDSLDE